MEVIEREAPVPVGGMAPERRATLPGPEQPIDFLPVFDRHPVPMWVYEIETLRILAVNGCAIDHYGYARDEFLKLRLTDLRPPEDVPDLLAAICRFDTKTARTGPWRHRRADGSILWANLAVQKITFGGKPAVLASAHDVTEQFTWKRAHELTEERFAMLVDAVEEYAILLLDPVGRVVSWNRGARRLYGFGEAEIVGRTAADLFPQSEPARTRYLEAIRAEDRPRGIHVEGPQVRADGSTFDADVLLASLDPTSPTPSGFVQITRDVTVLRAHERKLLEERERAEYLSVLTTRHLKEISRQVRTPLTGIIGAAELLAEDVDGDLRELADSIHRNGHYLLETAETALEYLQLHGQEEALVTSAIDLRGAAEAAVCCYRKQAAEAGIELILECSTEPVVARGEAEALGRVLAQLLRNALKFTPSGTVTVRVGCDASEAFIAVEDTGVGMAPDFLARAFESFAQEDSAASRTVPGSGLGLPIAHRQVRRMGGSLEAWSEIGVGSRFTVSLPAVR